MNGESDDFSSEGSDDDQSEGSGQNPGRDRLSSQNTNGLGDGMRKTTNTIAKKN